MSDQQQAAFRSALETMLRDIRERGGNRGEPCGVHDRPQWTCAFCLHEVLAGAEAALAAGTVPSPPLERVRGKS